MAINVRWMFGTLIAGVAFVAGCTGDGGQLGDRLSADSHHKDLMSYGAGYNLGFDVAEGLRMDGIEPNAELVAKGFRDGLQGNDPMIDRATFELVLEMVHEEMQARSVRRHLEENAEFRKLHDGNAARSRAYHESLKDNPEYTTTGSGLQYRVIESGDGRSPGPDDTVIVNYTLMNLSGSVLDERHSTEIRLNEIVEGGSRLLQLMKAGDKWEAAVPPALAFGAAGDPPVIGPNETIVVQVELLEVLPSGD